MGFAEVKAFYALELSLILLGCFTVSAQVDIVAWSQGDVVARSLRKKAPSPVRPPVVSPARAPSPSRAPTRTPIPTPSPSPAPSRAPSPYRLPPRALVAVQGVVFCKSCKYAGENTLLGASPLSGAVVRLKCNNTKNSVTQEAKTDKNGYFFLHAKSLTTYGVHKCKVFLVSSPSGSCKKPSNLHRGLEGDILRYEKPKTEVPFALYTVGPFAFSPSCPH